MSDALSSDFRSYEPPQPIIVAADVRRRRFGRLSSGNPPPHVGGYGVLFLLQIVFPHAHHPCRGRRYWPSKVFLPTRNVSGQVMSRGAFTSPQPMANASASGSSGLRRVAWVDPGGAAPGVEKPGK